MTTKSAPPGGIALWHHPAWDFALAAMCAALAGTKTWLATRISHRSGRTRRQVIVIECLMVGFALVLCLLTFNLDGGFIPFCAGAIGGIMSFVAAISLTRPPAKQYFAWPRSDREPTTTGPPNGDQERLFAILALRPSYVPG